MAAGEATAVIAWGRTVGGEEASTICRQPVVFQIGQLVWIVLQSWRRRWRRGGMEGSWQLAAADTFVVMCQKHGVFCTYC